VHIVTRRARRTAGEKAIQAGRTAERRQRRCRQEAAGTENPESRQGGSRQVCEEPDPRQVNGGRCEQ